MNLGAIIHRMSAYCWCVINAYLSTFLMFHVFFHLLVLLSMYLLSFQCHDHISCVSCIICCVNWLTEAV